jgi:hypothetical protein
MRNRLISLCVAIATAPVAAQSPEIAGFERELRNQKTALLVVVDDGKRGWSAALNELRKEDDFIDLELDLSLRSNADLIQHLQERHNLGPRPFWAIFSQGKLVGSGTGKPTLAVLKDLKGKAVWRGREEILRDFLRVNPDHREVHLQLLTALYRKAVLRTQVALALRVNPLREADHGWDIARDTKESEEAAELKRKEEEEGKIPKQLEPEADERIWGPFAIEWQKAFLGGEWRDWEWSNYRAEFMRHSPRMKEVFRKAYPEVEEALRQWPNRWSYWQVWLQASEVLGGLRLRTLLDALTPGPLADPESWPPWSVRTEYVKDCRKRKDWTSIKELLLPSWESERLWKSREKVKFVTLLDGKEVQTPWNSSEWRDQREPLVEALLRLGETQAADEIVRTLVHESVGGDLASKAAALAVKCGHPALAASWGALAPGKPR